jgi:hypothetical protein
LQPAAAACTCTASAQPFGRGLSIRRRWAAISWFDRDHLGTPFRGEQRVDPRVGADVHEEVTRPQDGLEQLASQ